MGAGGGERSLRWVEHFPKTKGKSIHLAAPVGTVKATGEGRRRASMVLSEKDYAPGFTKASGLSHYPSGGGIICAASKRRGREGEISLFKRGKDFGEGNPQVTKISTIWNGKKWERDLALLKAEFNERGNEPCANKDRKQNSQLAGNKNLASLALLEDRRSQTLADLLGGKKKRSEFEVFL